MEINNFTKEVPFLFFILHQFAPQHYLRFTIYDLQLNLRMSIDDLFRLANQPRKSLFVNRQFNLKL